MASERAAGILPCSNCIAVVPQDRVFVAEWFGRFTRILEPGLRCVGLDLCGTCVGLRSMSRRIEEIRVKASTKTKDSVFLNVVVSIQYAVSPKNAEQAFYSLTDIDTQLEAHASDCVRSAVPMLTLDKVFRNPEIIVEAVQNRVTEVMSPFGYDILRVLIVDLSPDSGVVEAMNSIFKERCLWAAAKLSSEAKKVLTVKAAEAESDATFLAGTGIARQRGAVLDGLRASISEAVGHEYGDKASAAMPGLLSELMLVTQQFETLQAIAANPKTSAVFIPDRHGEAAAVGNAGTRQDTFSKRPQKAQSAGSHEEKLKPKKASGGHGSRTSSTPANNSRKGAKK